ncbi:MAG: Fe-S-cluster-containing hydrogenase [Polyangiaceae bacterium]|nr:Fe-S-cluster-containing hydrogenase [Polyangiaceae bacterium]
MGKGAPTKAEQVLNDRREYWRALGDLAGENSADGRAEFPVGGDSRPDEPSRRRFLELIGASMALAGVTGCVKDPIEKILPYTVRPPEVTPGVSQYYATSMTLHGYATGLLVESREGRPIKIEGNPLHPASLGATGAFEQASILDLYDPHRARGGLHRGQLRPWDEIAAFLASPRPDGGAGLRILLEPTASPLTGELLTRLLQRYPRARITFYSPIHVNASIDGAAMAYGQRLQTHYDFSRASVIVSLDGDFLSSMPMHVRYANDFAQRRRPSWPNPTMNRLYVVESNISSTGSIADHRIRRLPSEIGTFAAALAAEIVLGEGAPGGMATGESIAALRPFVGREDRAVIRPIARDLRRAGASGVVVVGDEQPAHVHALGALMNAALGNGGGAMFTTAPVHVDMGASQQTFAELVAEMKGGGVDTLVILDGNPVYSASGDISFADAMRRVPNTIHLGMHVDETAALATWFVPAAHYLESWGDARSFDGTASIVQPLIRPLFGGHTSAEMLAALTGNLTPNGYNILRETWRSRFGAANFDSHWEAALRRGVIVGTAAPRTLATVKAGAGRATIEALAASAHATAGTYEVSFRADHRVFDGRYASNPWLQELPEPMTSLTWGNAARMSVKTARELGVTNGDLVELAAAHAPSIVAPGADATGPSIVLPALVVPGHADGAISLSLGYGRKVGSPIAVGVGTNVAPLRSGDGYIRSGIVARRKEGHVDLALTQTHWNMHGRPIVLSATLPEYQSNPAFTAHHRGRVLSILPAVETNGEKWAMTIDTSICTGCSSCVVACQAENNIPVVGPEQVMLSREMHWLRIDTYFSGAPEVPSVVHQPMLCQHCEKAPCEYVCPVNATVHSPDGLNEMVYNRCIGTRFCSNNCPYKVRRFNFFDWMEERASLNGDVRKLQKNPDVTVRERGVMEKCTFCVQRIRRAEIEASIERRSIRPGEVVPACAGACPTRAIQFGSLMHKETPMTLWRDEPRNYSVLHELGTQPRVQYLAMIKNPNPEMA